MTAGGMLTQHYLIRMKFVIFRRTAPQRLDKTFKTCSMCWSRWLLAGEVEWQRRNTPGLDEIDSRIVGLMPTPASMQASLAQAAPCASSSSVPDATELMMKLAQLVSWRKAGMLSEAEFSNVKKRIGR